jgi:hypothetical protein
MSNLRKGNNEKKGILCGIKLFNRERKTIQMMKNLVADNVRTDLSMETNEMARNDNQFTV